MSTDAHGEQGHGGDLARRQVSAPPAAEAGFRVLESGTVRFFVRPRADVQRIASLSDIQRFSFTLTPRNSTHVRRIAMGKKGMPDVAAHERQWAWVDRVGPPGRVTADFGPRTYATRTRGVRHQGEVIEVARGTYAITAHRDHAHLLLEVKVEGAIPGALVRQLRILPRASYVASVFNPEAPARPSVVSEGADEDEEEDRAERFGRRRFTPLEPQLLDDEGVELVLVGGGHSEARFELSNAIPPRDVQLKAR